MEHVECPQSEPANHDIELGRARLVATAHAKELGVNRETVGRYLRLSKPAISITAIQVLRDLGYLNVGSLKGGLQGWLEAGGLVESSGGRNSGSSRQTRPICARSDW